MTRPFVMSVASYPQISSQDPKSDVPAVRHNVGSIGLQSNRVAFLARQRCSVAGWEVCERSRLGRGAGGRFGSGGRDFRAGLIGILGKRYR